MSNQKKEYYENIQLKLKELDELANYVNPKYLRPKTQREINQEMQKMIRKFMGFIMGLG